MWQRFDGPKTIFVSLDQFNLCANIFPSLRRKLSGQHA